jgi:hypothetical protein
MFYNEHVNIEDLSDNSDSNSITKSMNKGRFLVTEKVPKARDSFKIKNIEDARKVFKNSGEVYEPNNYRNVSLTDLSSENENMTEQRFHNIDQYETHTYDGIDKGYNRFESTKKVLDQNQNYNEIVHQGSINASDRRSHKAPNSKEFVIHPAMKNEMIYSPETMLDPMPKIENKSFENNFKYSCDAKVDPKSLTHPVSIKNLVHQEEVFGNNETSPNSHQIIPPNNNNSLLVEGKSAQNRFMIVGSEEVNLADFKQSTSDHTKHMFTDFHGLHKSNFDGKNDYNFHLNFSF